MIDWINLTEIAQQNILDPVIGREQELERIIQVLLRRTRNNPLLVGAPGVGKTALVEGLAQRIVSGQVPDTLRRTRIYTFDLGLALAQARASGDMGSMESLFISAMTALQQLREPDTDMPPHQRRLDTILFIDELHLLVTRISDGAAGIASLIRLALSQGRFAIISETTPDHYQQYQAQADLDRYFHAIPILEPTREETVAILQGLTPRFAEFHQATIADDAVHAAVDLAIRYLPQRALPDKAVDLLDEAAGRVRGREREMTADPASPSERPRMVTRRDVEEVVAIWTGLPLAQSGAGTPRANGESAG
jgi:ATP-dependent Clp protease ATP-binding subunit ClpA